ncbi:hypothetical protein [Microbispora sp. NPDC046933]|uniref:hypothetical protein n=1 Tax=Microbispora sp. NPDC046933 TaxID=3155618 RepID=UPI00340BE230
MEPPERYRWLRRTEFDDLAAVLWCANVSPEEVFAGFGLPPADADHATLADACDPDCLDETYDDEVALLIAGALGGGAVAMLTQGFASDETMRRLSTRGPCFQAGWSDFCPPIVDYAEHGTVLFSFNYISWEFLPEPDLSAVEAWMETTPPRRSGWREFPGLAMVLTGEAICGAVIDEAWLARPHLVSPLNR